MSNLPNNEKNKIKTFANEYITSVTVNRPNLRLLQNDLYLEQLFDDAISGIFHVSGILTNNELQSMYSTVSSNSAQWDESTDINYLSGQIENNNTNIDTLSGNMLSAAIFTNPPNMVSANGNNFEIAVSGEYLYVYHNLSGDLNWGRVKLDYIW